MLLIRDRDRCATVLLIGLLLVHSSMLAYNARWMSPTLDEPAHIVAGLSHWKFGHFSLYRVNPPLVRMVAALPIMASGYKFDFPERSSIWDGRHEFHLGEQFVAENGRRTLWLTVIARWACIPFSLLGATLCYFWGKDLYGIKAGLLACTLWCFSPMVLGHAALLTPDAHAASLGLLACYGYWCWLKTPTWRLTIWTGVALGMAGLAKTTFVLLYPMWLILWIVYRLSKPGTVPLKRWGYEGTMLGVRMLIGLYLVNLCYLGDGSFIPLKEYSFVSELLGGNTQSEGTNTRNRFSDSLLGQMPVPLPSDYVYGIDFQQRDFESFGRPSYLRGVFQEEGWWYYYLYAASVKTPLGTIAIVVIAIVLRFWYRGKAAQWRDEMILTAPAVVIFLVVSSKWGFSHHYRYIFPCIPFFFIWISQTAALSKPTNLTVRSCKVCWTSAVIISAIATVCGSILCFPHSLAYFNQTVGGPSHGAEHLLNSNIDWGQDLIHLEHWSQANAEESAVYLAYDGSLNPFDLQIEYITPWPFHAEAPDVSVEDSRFVVEDGFYAISVNQLYEFPWPLRGRDGHRYFIDKRPLAPLRHMNPIGSAGFSIRIFSAEQLRIAYASQQ